MFGFCLIYFIICSLLPWPSTELDVYIIRSFGDQQNTNNIIYDRVDIEPYDEATEAIDIDNNDYTKEMNMEDLYPDSNSEDKIVGGFPTEISLYPYHIAYGNNCGGALIASRWALTAGHCGRKSYIRVGSKYFGQGRKIAVKRNFIHPNWSTQGKDHPFDFDFQVLELSEDLPFNENIQPIKVARIDDMIVGKILTVTGWGNTKENGPFSDVLRAVRVPIVSKEACQRVPFPYFKGQLTPRMFCAGYSEGIKDACQGDSGGPAVAGDRLLGMVSFGYGCATPGSFGVYSKVAKVRPWIEQVTGLRSDNQQTLCHYVFNLDIAHRSSHIVGGNPVTSILTLQDSPNISPPNQISNCWIGKPANVPPDGGYNIDIEEAPYQVSYGDICGAVLIHQTWAITVAHCGTEVNFIRVGSKYRLKGFKVRIVEHYIHPLFRRNHEFDHDVQLLLLEEPLKASRTTGTIDISDGEHGDYVYVTGWGYAVENGDFINTLQRVRISMVDMDRCQKISLNLYNHTLTSRMFCAGGGRRDACQGDNGGAAVCYQRLVGLSSFGHGCGRHIPGVYTNVSSLSIRVWIRRHTGI